MKKLAVILSFTLGVALDAQQPPATSEIRRTLTESAEALLALSARIADPPPAQMVRAGDDLQAALNRGGTIELQSGATFPVATRFVVTKDDTIIRGHGATLSCEKHSTCLQIPPAVHRTVVSDLFVRSAGEQEVVSCGENGPNQVNPAVEPTGVVFWNVTVPQHRGKRAFSINCQATLIDSSALDVYAPSGVDSQALWIGNTCGPVKVLGGVWEAQSENILSGGDSQKLPCHVRNLVFDRLHVRKRPEWRTMTGIGTAKCLFEIKAGDGVVLKNSILENSWGSWGAWAIVLTPRNNAYVRDVLIEGNTIRNVGGGVQLLGTDNTSTTPHATSGIVIRNNTFDISKANWGGVGRFMLQVEGVLAVTVENTTITQDGNSLVLVDSKTPTGPFSMRASTANLGVYGIMAPGTNYGNPTPAEYASRPFTRTIEGNTFSLGPGMTSAGYSVFKANFPNNVYQ